MNILVFAPHNDDEILGVGGTMAKYAAAGHNVYVCEVTCGPLDNPMVQQQKQEALASHRLLGLRETIFLDLPVVGLKEMPTVPKNATFQAVVQRIRPDIAYIPFRGDMHIDHQEVADAAMVALRPVECPWTKAIYAYETLSETGWNYPSPDMVFVPTFWEDITLYLSAKKAAMALHKSQLRDAPNPRSLEAIDALAKYRGASVCCEAAEAFVLVRGISSSC